ncbi:MAG: hypothetical protein KDB63_15650 [Nocardioidaceae bacterium]|nr:hypothetical protein [Nocardioidaceae bacterium]
MINTDLVPYAITLLVVAVIASIASIVVAATVLAETRRERLARHESISTYYRELVSSH